MSGIESARVCLGWIKSIASRVSDKELGERIRGIADMAIEELDKNHG